jgi:hypothetical protein
VWNPVPMYRRPTLEGRIYYNQKVEVKYPDVRFIAGTVLKRQVKA